MFIPTRARQRLGTGSSVQAGAGRAWAVAVRFAAYSFNKAHAAAYAWLAYYSAYLKTHHPVQFACALLNHHQGLYPLRVEANEMTRMGVRLSGPQVNVSEKQSQVVRPATGNEEVRVGLVKVKGLSRRAASALVSQRGSGGAYRSLSDLLLRVRLTKSEVRALVLCGACDGLNPLEAGNYPFAHDATLELLGRDCDPAELDRLRYPEAVAGTATEKERVRLYQAMVRVRNELQYLEMHLSAHPMALLRAEAERYGVITLAKAGDAPPDTGVVVAGVVAAMRRVPTRQGRMLFLTLEDETGLLEAVLFPDAYRKVGGAVETPGPFLVQGEIRVQQGAVHLEVKALRPFHERSVPYGGTFKS